MKLKIYLPLIIGSHLLFAVFILNSLDKSTIVSGDNLRAPSSISRIKGCYKKLFDYLQGPKESFARYVQEVKESKGLRIFLNDHAKDDQVRKIANFFEVYERPQDKASVFDVPMNTVQYLPRKLSSLISKNNTEYNFTPLYALSTPFRKALHAGTLKAFGVKKDFTILSHIITGVVVIGALENKYFEKLEDNVDEAFLNKIRGEWDRLSESMESDRRLIAIKTTYEHSKRELDLAKAVGLMSEQDYDKKLQTLKDKASLESTLVQEEMKLIIKVSLNKLEMDDEKRSEFLTALYEGGSFFSDLRELERKGIHSHEGEFYEQDIFEYGEEFDSRLSEEQVNLLFEARVRKVFAQTLIVEQAYGDDTSNHSNELVKKLSDELNEHSTLNYLKSKLDSGSIDQSTYIKESQLYLEYVEQFVQFDIQNIKKRHKDEDGHFVDGKFYLLDDLKKDYLTLIESKY